MEQMTVKERILNAIKGLEVDRPSWSPFLAYYYEMLTPEERSVGMFKYLQNMGADPIIRGGARAFTVNDRNDFYQQKIVGDKRYFCYDTPVGKLNGTYTYSQAARSWFLTEHLVKEKEDFKILSYLVSHTSIEDDFVASNAEYDAVGDNGLCMGGLGAWSKTAFQSMLEHWCGTEALTYALCDYPEEVEETLEVMRAKNMETIELSAKAKPEAFIFYEDTSTTNISPSMFEEYIAPEINSWSKVLHDNDKLLIHHACGHLKDLLPMMGATGIDMVESLSPPPTGNIDVGDSFKLLPQHVGIIGGIEPTFFLNCSMEELEARTHELLKIAQGKRYILANSDSCPPGVSYEKFQLVSKLVKEMQK